MTVDRWVLMQNNLICRWQLEFMILVIYPSIQDGHWETSWSWQPTNGTYFILSHKDDLLVDIKWDIFLHGFTLISPTWDFGFFPWHYPLGVILILCIILFFTSVSHKFLLILILTWMHSPGNASFVPCQCSPAVSNLV